MSVLHLLEGGRETFCGSGYVIQFNQDVIGNVSVLFLNQNNMILSPVWFNSLTVDFLSG